MNLHNVVRGAVTSINQDVTATLKINKGYTTAADGTRTPSFETYNNIEIQVQNLNNDALQHSSNLNSQTLQGTVFIPRTINGIVRRDAKGGDILIFNSKTWIVTHVQESWEGWSKAIVTMQA